MTYKWLTIPEKKITPPWSWVITSFLWGKLFGGTVPPNNTLFGGTVMNAGTLVLRYANK